MAGISGGRRTRMRGFAAREPALAGGPSPGLPLTGQSPPAARRARTPEGAISASRRKNRVNLRLPDILVCPATLAGRLLATTGAHGGLRAGTTLTGAT